MKTLSGLIFLVYLHIKYINVEETLPLPLDYLRTELGLLRHLKYIFRIKLQHQLFKSNLSRNVKIDSGSLIVKDNKFF